jgi:pimeloyl-ACP methyl ester carboxylesterase
MAQRFSGVGSRLEDVRTQIGRVGPLLARYEGPTLIVFGETDPYWSGFTKRINPSDRLRLSKMKSPPKLVVVTDGDHMFSSADTTAQLIGLSVSWAEAFRQGHAPTSYPEELYAFFAPSTAN